MDNGESIRAFGYGHEWQLQPLAEEVLSVVHRMVMVDRSKKPYDRGVLAMLDRGSELSCEGFDEFRDGVSFSAKSDVNIWWWWELSYQTVCTLDQ